METIKQTVDSIGRHVLAHELGCGLTAISNAITRGGFPASWHPVVKSLAEKKGIEVSDDLFNWRQSQTKGE